MDKTLDITIEKGKGPVLGKLRTIQLIEADLQLVMRILVNNRNKNKISFCSDFDKYHRESDFCFIYYPCWVSNHRH